MPPYVKAGYLGWSINVIPPRYYLGGRWFQVFVEVGNEFVSQGSQAVAPVTAQDRTDTLVRPYRGDERPLASDRIDVAVSVLADFQADYLFLKFLRSTGQGFQAFLGGWACDSFQATTGNTYKLSRPVATDILTDEISAAYLFAPKWPTTFLLDGVAVEEAPATVSGDVVTASATGLLSVFYAPLYTLYCSKLSEALEDSNRWRISLGLQEIFPE